MQVEVRTTNAQFHHVSAGEAQEVKVGRGDATNAQLQTGRPASTETLTLTETASRLQQLESTLTRLPVVDTKRVESIKREIDNGSYEIDAERIADGMLGFEDLFSSKGITLR